MKLVYFKNDQCNVCKAVLEKAKQFSIENNLELEVIDVVKNPEIAGQMLVFTVPTIILQHENSEIKRFARNFSFYDVENTVNKFKEILA